MTRENWDRIFIDGVASSPNLGADLYFTYEYSDDPHENVMWRTRNAYYRLAGNIFVASIDISFNLANLSNEQNASLLAIGGIYRPSQRCISDCGSGAVSVKGRDSFSCLIRYNKNIILATASDFNSGIYHQSYVHGNTFDPSNGEGGIRLNYTTAIV